MAQQELGSNAFPNPTVSPIAKYLAGNKDWAKAFNDANPCLFDQLNKEQKPAILWIGCSDSRVPENTLLNLKPGQVFTTRNIANILHASDLSSLAAIQYAVEHLHVKHIMLCGHTKCGGIDAALGTTSFGPVLDAWILPVRILKAKFRNQLNKLQGEEKNRFLEIENVKAGVKQLREMGVVAEAIEHCGLTIHGLIYNVGTGILTEIEVPTSSAQSDHEEKEA